MRDGAREWSGERRGQGVDWRETGPGRGVVREGGQGGEW